MDSPAHPTTGFTLVELMVTIAVILTLAMLALPSFEGLRQRSAMRGAADQTLNFWNQARMEALKRNQMVKVGLAMSGTDGTTFCLGAATTTSSADATPCDCTTAGACNIGQYPGFDSAGTALQISEWNGVALSGATVGGGTVITSLKAVVIDPKRLFLTESGDAGAITLSGPPGRFAYKVNLVVDRFGRGYLCQSSSAVDTLSDYTNTNRVCAP